MDHSADNADPNGEARNGGHDDGAGASASDGSNPSSSGSNEKSVAPSGRGKGLRPAPDAFSDLEPFFERVESSAGRGPWPRLEPLLSYGSHAALALCVMGFAWAAGSHFFGGPTQNALKATAIQDAARREAAESAEIRRATQKMSEDMRALKANLDGLRASVAQNQNSKDQHALEKGLDGLKTRLDAVKTETGAAIAELSGKVEHMQREPAAKLQQVVERLDRIERQTAAPVTTASIPASTATAKSAAPNRTQIMGAPPKPLSLPPETAEAPKKPQLITSWVVRDVYDGVALVENATGSLEVAPGETIPGAGTVKSIERRGAGWIVITSRGLVDSAHDVYLP
ncbi:hypothetical protein RZS28_12045 [Methylocapsa polymorpha]|uniref:Uncharacterized protein n=1 Tax=Methylocapsa polymorpha TaxID=3080828 RepID=A0ABZ0HP18_9HYPH|nr:hypothetical protein RZS28_12045 [Methylocapsa sp. RX1]